MSLKMATIFEHNGFSMYGINGRIYNITYIFNQNVRDDPSDLASDNF